MMLAALALLAGWGTALVLADVSWWARMPLVERLRPYHAARGRPHRRGLWAFATARDLAGPVCRAIGERIAALFGIHESVTVRLERIHSPLDATRFRVRQLGWATATSGAVGAIDTVVRAPAPVAFVALAGAPLLVFLVIEQRLAAASADWQDRLFHELPVVAEQLSMLLHAGYSTGGALARLAGRSTGCAGRDLAVVCARIRQGLSERQALDEWAERAGSEPVRRLVATLARGSDSPDLGRLVSEEARALRREAHRVLVETIERRSQLVWIPVTVAALVPGVLFLAIPFFSVVKVFAGT